MPVTEPTEAAPPIADLTFDDALAELQRTIAELETGGLPLERTLALHERGAALLRRLADDVDRGRFDLDEIDLGVGLLQVVPELLAVREVAGDSHLGRSMLVEEVAFEALGSRCCGRREERDPLPFDGRNRPRPQHRGDHGDLLDLADRTGNCLVVGPLLRHRQHDEVGDQDPVGVEVTGH